MFQLLKAQSFYSNPSYHYVHFWHVQIYSCSLGSSFWDEVAFGCCIQSRTWGWGNEISKLASELLSQRRSSQHAFPSSSCFYFRGLRVINTLLIAHFLCPGVKQRSLTHWMVLRPRPCPHKPKWTGWYPKEQEKELPITGSLWHFPPPSVLSPEHYVPSGHSVYISPQICHACLLTYTGLGWLHWLHLYSARELTGWPGHKCWLNLTYLLFPAPMVFWQGVNGGGRMAFSVVWLFPGFGQGWQCKGILMVHESFI